MTLKPPRSKRIYVVLINPEVKPKETRSLTLYGITVDEAFDRIVGLFEERESPLFS